MKPMIVISMGDAAGIGPEITVKALADAMVQEKANCIILGDKRVCNGPLICANST